jgi:hypothetical protein
MRRRKTETALAYGTLGILVLYIPVETWVSLPNGLLNPFYLVDAIAMALLLWGALHSLRARPRPAPELLCVGVAWATANGWRATFGRLHEIQSGGTLEYGSAEMWTVGCATAIGVSALGLTLALVALNHRKGLEPSAESKRGSEVVFDEPLSRDEYLDLYKFFESRAETIKAGMFASVTWVLGFAAGVLGFAVSTFADFEGGAVTVKHPQAGVVASLAGIALCGYALFLLYDAAHHIGRNWERAGECQRKVAGLSEVIKAGRVSAPRLKVWYQIGIVVVLFLMAHVAAIAFWLNA